MLACEQSDRQIKEYWESEIDVKVTVRNINWYRYHKKAEVASEKEKLRRDLMAIPVADKIYRLSWSETFAGLLGQNQADGAARLGPHPSPR